MSIFGAHIARIIKAANVLRKKIAEFDEATLEPLDFTVEAGKNPQLILTRKSSLLFHFTSFGRTVDSLRAQREKAEEFARQHPDEKGEFSLLQQVQDHWDTNGLDDLVEEAETLRDRLDAAIKLLPSSEALYFCTSAVPFSFSNLTLNQTQIPTFALQPAQDESLEVTSHLSSHDRDRPADLKAVVPAGQVSPPACASSAAHGFDNFPHHPLPHPLFANPPLVFYQSNPFKSFLVPSSSSFSSLEQSSKSSTIEIPIFHGDVDEFLDFWDIFSTAVHDNINVPVLMKFIYLKLHLRGSAASIIAGFRLSAENYEDAVRTLTNTYGRPEVLRSRLWDKLVQLPPASDSPMSQRATLRTIKAIWTQLTRFKESSRAIGTLKTIWTKFPRYTREKIGEHRRGDSTWTVDRLLSTLDTIIDRLEAMEDTDPSDQYIYNPQMLVRPDSSSPHEYSSANRDDSTLTPYGTFSYHYRCSSASRTPSLYVRHDRPPTPYYPRSASRSSSKSHYVIPVEPYCAFCHDPRHSSARCGIVWDIALRRATLFRYKLCWLCLYQRHHYTQCDAPLCEYCGRIHHRALCWNLPRPRTPPVTSVGRTRCDSPDTFYLPERVQFQREAYGFTSRASRGHSRALSSRSSHSRSPVPPRPQPLISLTRCAILAHGLSPISVVHSTICTPDLSSTSMDARVKLWDYHRVRVSYSPSSCTFACSQRSARQPRFMAVHAATKNYKMDMNELLTVFIDSSSRYSFISASLAEHLGLLPSNVKTSTTRTFESYQFTEESSRITLTLWDQHDYPIHLELWARGRITIAPRINTQSDKDIVDIENRGEIDVLIGVDNYWRIVDLYRNKDLPSGLALLHTRLGPVLSALEHSFVSNPLLATRTLFEDEEIARDQRIRSPFGLDLAAIQEQENTEHDNIINRFYDTVRIVDGHIYVSLPWKDQHPPLADNKALALSRLRDQYDRFRAMPSLWNDYCQAIDEQLKMGIVEDVTRVAARGPNVYYIPHQAVFEQDSAATKFRIVLDVSSHQEGVPSLNDCLQQGPSFLSDLVGTLMRSRFHNYLVIADVESAFHQIHLHQDQRDSTRFLWLKDVHQPPLLENLRVLRFTRLPSGVNASPFLLSMSIRYFLEQDPANRLKEEILANTYMNSVVVGARTTQECVDKCEECKDIFYRMHMNLQEFVSNNRRVLASVPQGSHTTAQGHYVNLLGVRWNPMLDVLHVPLNIARQQVTSKRTALRAYMLTFDPLGLLTPLLIRAKMFIQDLWESGYGWDDHLTQEDVQKWNRIVQDMSGFQLSVPRFICDTEDTYDLVVCPKASKRVYVTAVYVITRHQGIVRSTLLFAKAKLAPPDAITIARMELLACHMAAKIVQFLKAQLKVRFRAIKFLTDSQIALYWIYADKPLKIYVANRVGYIRRVLDELEAKKISTGFYYLTTQTNPVGCATGGLTALEFQQHLWWTGPIFFTTPFSQWPCRPFHSSQPIPLGAESEEFHISKVVVSVDSIQKAYKSFVPFTRANSYVKLVRITAYVLKYVVKLRHRVRTRSRCEAHEECFPFDTMNIRPMITSDDFTAAELVLIREHYRESQCQMDGSYVKKLHIRHETDGTVRVDLCASNVQTDRMSKNPILILSSHPLCDKLITHYHLQLFHTGSSHLISALGERFFIPRIERLVESVIAKCVICRRHQGRAYTPSVALELPVGRTMKNRPFQHIGLDYFGPLSVRSLTSECHKVWISLFTCTTTRALHLEVVRDSSTHQFLMAFRRFMAHRGTPDTVTSDGAPTFELGEETIKNQLPQVVEDAQMDQFLESHNIKWSFTTPYSPWKEGFYGRLIGSVKIALKKAIRSQILDLWLLETLIVEIEAILNTRPLFPVNPVNLDANAAIRPIDLISPRSRVVRLKDTLPHKMVNLLNDSRQMPNTRCGILQDTLDRFWDFWQKDYLTALANRVATCEKSCSSESLPRVGEVVLMRQDAPRASWPLGLILELYNLSDDNTRSARIKTDKRRITHRAINHLLPLELLLEDKESTECDEQDRAKARQQH